MENRTVDGVRSRRIRDAVRQQIIKGAMLLAASLALPAMADPAHVVRHEVSIESQSVAASLRALAQQTGVQMLVLTEDAANKRAPAVHGNLTTDEALSKILDASGLTFQRIDDHTVAIRKGDTEAPPKSYLHSTSYGLADEKPEAIQTVDAPDPAATAGGGSSEPAAALQEVVVTGSRIKRKEYSSNSPLITVESEQLESRSGLNVESYLNQLPNYNPAATPTSEAQDVQPTALTTVGISTISLRGLGANRSLVLIDGHRATPVNALMVTDINTIPSSLIDRVETVSGGESAVYGADAMGGVTNFILKKDFQGLQVDVQDGMSQVGDDNELRVSALMGVKFSDGKGSIITGTEYYDRHPAYQSLRNFYTDAWADPNELGVSSRLYGTNGVISSSTASAAPSAAAVGAILGMRTPPALVSSTGSTAGSTFQFNPGGTLFASSGPLATSNYSQLSTLSPGVLRGDGYALQNAYNSLQTNSASNATAPDMTQVLKWANPTTLLSLPQTRYSFFANGKFELTDNITFFTNARFAQSLTRTRLSNLMSITTGWDVEVPYNQATDDPIRPGLITPTTSAATAQTIAASFANGTAGTLGYSNPGFIGLGKTGVQHPIPWQLAMLLDSRTVGTTPATGGPAVCNTGYSTVNATTHAAVTPPCSTAPASWSLSYLPGPGQMADRATTDTDTSWQIETGLDFPLHLGDWTGELYYSRGQSSAYQDAFGNDSLERVRALVDAPGYGANLAFQGNAGSTSPAFGTSVPATCSSGYYDAIFNYQTPSANCQQAVGSILQTMTQVQQDIVEANFQGSLFNLPAGTLSAAAGFQYRRDAAQFVPDTLQSTSSFLDQTVGVYPTANLDAQTMARDGYLEFLVPVVKDLPFLKKLDFDLGGRYSTYDVSPNSTTFKVDVSAQIIDSVRLRGGFNRATRTPNLGELFLNMQEYLGAGSVYGDPCSLRSSSPFGAANAPGVVNASLSDAKLPALNGGNPLNAGGAAGATSTYLICQAMMGGANSLGTNQYYSATASQAGAASPALIGAFQNQVGNPNLRAETADTWTGGIVLSHLFEHPLLRNFSATADYYRISIQNAIELEGSDYANYLCYGATQVSDAAAAAAQAGTAACQNVNRNLTTGGTNIIGLQFNNLATIATSGVDFSLNWNAQLSDMGLGRIPGSIGFYTQSSWLNYYRTKASPLNFDVDTDWKGTSGPTLSGTNGGAYTLRTYQTISYILPTFSASLHWTYLPSINSAGYATQQATIAHNQQAVAAGRPQDILSYSPTTANALPHYNNIGLSFNWTINDTLQVRGGIDNLFDAWPAISTTRGYTTQAQIQAACSAAAKSLGCLTPSSYSLPTESVAGVAGYYDTIGRRFYLGLKARF